MGSSAPPYILPDFPRSEAQLQQLEASVGAVACFVELRGAEDGMAEAMLKQLRPSGRVHQVDSTDAAGAVEVLRGIGFAIKDSDVAALPAPVMQMLAKEPSKEAKGKGKPS